MIRPGAFLRFATSELERSFSPGPKEGVNTLSLVAM
jgi:hypothetical protein